MVDKFIRVAKRHIRIILQYGARTTPSAVFGYLILPTLFFLSICTKHSYSDDRMFLSPATFSVYSQTEQNSFESGSKFTPALFTGSAS